MNSDGTNATFRAMFKEPLEIQPNTNYTAVSFKFITRPVLQSALVEANFCYQVSTLKGLDSHYGTKGLRKVKFCFSYLCSLSWLGILWELCRWLLIVTTEARWPSSSAMQQATTMAPLWRTARFLRLSFILEPTCDHMAQASKEHGWYDCALARVWYKHIYHLFYPCFPVMSIPYQYVSLYVIQCCVM